MIFAFRWFLSKIVFMKTFLSFSILFSFVAFCTFPLAESLLQKKKEEPLIPETCVIKVVVWPSDQPNNKYPGKYDVNQNRVTSSFDTTVPARKDSEPIRHTGVFEGTLSGNVITGTLKQTMHRWHFWYTGGPSQALCNCERHGEWTAQIRIVLNPDHTLNSMSNSNGTLYEDCQGGGCSDRGSSATPQSNSDTGRGTWEIAEASVLPETTSPTTETSATEPPATIRPEEELQSIGKVEGQERYIALPKDPNAEEMTLPRMREYINQLLDGYKQAKEMYLDAKARVKALEDEEKDLRLSLASWESQEANIDTEKISGQLREHHLKIKDLDKQFDRNAQESIVGQKLPDLNQTGGVDKLGLSKEQISNIETKNEALETKDYKARTEIRSEAETVKGSSVEFMKLQDGYNANKAFEQTKILELNDQLKRHRELNQKIEEGRSRLEKLQFEIENGKEKVANYLAICQQGREKLRAAYEQYKALEEKNKK